MVNPLPAPRFPSRDRHGGASTALLGHRSRPLVWAVAFWVALAPRAGAQLVQGRITDGTSGLGLSEATIRLVDPEGMLLRVFVSDQEGWYHVPSLAPGEYSLVVQRFGYRGWVQPPFRMVGADTLRIDIALEPNPFVMDPIVAEARSREGQEPGREGFARRCAEGTGYCFDVEAIRRMRPRYPSQIISAGVPEMIVSYTADRTPRFRPVNHWPCVKVYIDNAVWNQGEVLARELGPEAELERLPIDEIMGIEVYLSFRKTPLELRTGLRGADLWPSLNPATDSEGSLWPCGQILVWTRKYW